MQDIQFRERIGTVSTQETLAVIETRELECRLLGQAQRIVDLAVHNMNEDWKIGGMIIIPFNIRIPKDIRKLIKEVNKKSTKNLNEIRELFAFRVETQLRARGNFGLKVTYKKRKLNFAKPV